MGKAFKKIGKTLVKFDLGHQAAKGMGLPDPVGDATFGSNRALSPAERADKLAKTQMQFDKQQADRASADAVEQARASAQAIQLQQDRANMTQAAADAKPVSTDTVEVDLGTAVGDAAARRKKFTSTSTSAGQGSEGPAIRI